MIEFIQLMQSTWIYWAVTLLALVGVIINIKHDPRCFIIWAVTNAAFAVRTFTLGAYEMTFLFSIYWVLAIIGLYAWRKNPHQSLTEEVAELRIQNEYMRRAILSAETLKRREDDGK